MNDIASFIEEERFYHYYQPIFNLETGIKIAYEGLLRSKEYKSPEVPFQIARKENILYRLDTRSMYKAMLSYFEVQKSGEDIDLLFLNILPSTLIHLEFQSFIDKIKSDSRIQNQKIVFEINEVEEIPYSDLFLKNINDLKKEGFIIAVDDVGMGYSSLRTIIELQPKFVKMDRYFALDLSLSETKQEMLKSIVTFCGNIGSQLVLEGIEEERDLEMAKALGVIYGQGYLLGKPSSL
jgi:EAL domain-containing protein (putative c-di-GMP-specific phosphodiesterase class I)